MVQSTISLSATLNSQTQAWCTGREYKAVFIIILQQQSCHSFIAYFYLDKKFLINHYPERKNQGLAQVNVIIVYTITNTDKLNINHVEIKIDITITIVQFQWQN